MKITAPPSKAHTLRALFIGALANGKTTLINPLLAEDQLHAMSTLKQLGADFTIKPNQIVINGTEGVLSVPKESLHVGNSGVTCRFLTPLAALPAEGTVTIDGDSAMRMRPLAQLLNALKNLGVDAKSETGCPPVTIPCGSFTGGHASIKGNISSQYLSSLLISAPYAKKDVFITVEGPLKSRPYVEITLEMMRKFGADISEENGTYKVKSGQHYQGQTYSIEGDYSNASYFMAAAAITGKQITVDNLSAESLQGDRAILNLLQQCECSIAQTAKSVTVTGNSLKAIEVNMSDTPDLVPTMAIIAAFSKGTSRFTGIEHLRFKETDRLQAILNELSKMGIRCSIDKEDLIIAGGAPKPAAINTYRDHRIAMAFSIAQLVVPKTEILDPSCVNKSFPNFFEELKSLQV